MKKMTETAMRKADGGRWYVRWINGSGRYQLDSFSNLSTAHGFAEAKRKAYGYDWAAVVLNHKKYVVYGQ